MIHKQYLYVTPQLRLCVAVALGAVIVARPDEVVVSTASLPREVHEALANNASAVGNTYIEYRAVTVFPTQRDGNYEATYYENYEQGRFYQRRERHDTSGGRRRDIDEIAFDGTFYYSGSIGREGTLMRALAADVTDPLYRRSLVQFPYYDATGFYVPRSLAHMHTNRTVDSLLLQYLGDSDDVRMERVGGQIRVTVGVPDEMLLGARNLDLTEKRKELERQNRTIREDRLPFPILPVNEIIDGLRRQQTMAPRRIVMFVIDSRYNYGVVERHEHTVDGQWIAEVRLERWKQFHDHDFDVWLPERCIYSDYRNTFTGQFMTRPFLISTYDLQRIDFHPRGTNFALDQNRDYRRPGTVIVDRCSVAARGHTNHQIVFRVAGDGGLLRSAADEASEQLSGRAFLILFVTAGVSLLLWRMFLKGSGR